MINMINTVCDHTELDYKSNTTGVLLEARTYPSRFSGWICYFSFFSLSLSLSLSLSVFVNVVSVSVYSILDCSFRFSLTFMLPVSVFVPFLIAPFDFL
jgi:hypothetical protein